MFSKLFPRQRVTFNHPITGQVVEYGGKRKNKEIAE
jgi:hypothetical protein